MTDEPEALPGTATQSPAIGEQQALSDDPAAAAFEELRKEVAMVHRVMAGLAAERTTIPNYSETLGQILQACKAAAWRFEKLGELPALRLTPEAIGRQIDTAAELSRRAHHAALTDASSVLRQTTQYLSGHLQSARTAKSQRIWLAATGAVCLVTGMILWAIVAGYVDRSPPIDHRSPEVRAAAILGMEQTAAGEHLIQVSAPTLWKDIVLGNRIVIANRHTLDICLKDTGKQRKRCVITIPAAKP